MSKGAGLLVRKRWDLVLDDLYLFNVVDLSAIAAVYEELHQTGDVNEYFFRCFFKQNGNSGGFKNGGNK